MYWNVQGSPVSIDTSNSFTVSPPHAASSDVPCAIAQPTKNLAPSAPTLHDLHTVFQHYRIPHTRILTPPLHSETATSTTTSCVSFTSPPHLPDTASAPIPRNLLSPHPCSARSLARSLFPLPWNPKFQNSLGCAPF